jgi:branched-chain amino acid transport system substrate-binding protein
MIRFLGRSPAVLLALALLAGGCRSSDEPIVIGIAGPFSAPNGVSMLRAAELAIDELNEQRRAQGKRPLELAAIDDSASPNYAMQVATRLRDSPEVVAVVGHLNSAATKEAAAIYGAPAGGEVPGRPVAHVSPASSSPELSGLGPWSFRITPTDLEFAPRLALWAAEELGSRRAIVLYVNDTYGQGVIAGFEESFGQLGGSVVSRGPYLTEMFNEDDDLDAYLIRGLRRDADAVVIGGQAGAGLRIVRAARRLGYTGPILGADGLTAIKDIGGAEADGVFISSAFLPDRPTPRAQAFVQAYQTRYQGALPDHRGAMAYDVVYMLARAIDQVGTDRGSIRDYVAGIGRTRPEFEGVSGTVIFDENGDAVGKEVAVGVVRGGQLVTVSR